MSEASTEMNRKERRIADPTSGRLRTRTRKERAYIKPSVVKCVKTKKNAGGLENHSLDVDLESLPLSTHGSTSWAPTRARVTCRTLLWVV